MPRTKTCSRCGKVRPATPEFFFRLGLGDNLRSECKECHVPTDDPEDQRHTVQVKLRLSPEVAQALDELAEEWGETRSATVGRLVKERGR